MRIFLSGGCKNGKSTCAQHLAKRQGGRERPLYYVATMIAADGEDMERIDRHRKEREGWGFVTVEQPLGIAEILRKCDRDGSFLIDSLTALLANEMFAPSGEFDAGACERVANDMSMVLSQICDVAVVSDYIYSDAFIYDPLTEAYRKSLAALDRLAAKHCDVVLEAAHARIVAHKGGELFEKTFGEARDAIN